MALVHKLNATVAIAQMGPVHKRSVTIARVTTVSVIRLAAFVPSVTAEAVIRRTQSTQPVRMDTAIKMIPLVPIVWVVIAIRLRHIHQRAMEVSAIKRMAMVLPVMVENVNRWAASIVLVTAEAAIRPTVVILHVLVVIVYWFVAPASEGAAISKVV
jgi:hypothetical protein